MNLERIEMLASACHALAEAGLVDQALKQAAEIKPASQYSDQQVETWERWRACTAIAGALVEAGQVDRAVEIARQVIADTRDQAGRSSRYGQMIGLPQDSFFEQRAGEERGRLALVQVSALAGLAWTLSQGLQGGGKTVDAPAHQALIDTILEVLNQADSVAGFGDLSAFQVTSGAFDLVLDADGACLDAIWALLACGDHQAASRWVEKIGYPQAMIQALVNLGAALAGAGDEQAALRLQQEAGRLADGLARQVDQAETGREKLDALLSAAGWMFWLNRAEEAAGLAVQAQETAAGMTRRQDRAEAQARIARLYIEFGDEGSAAQLVERALSTVEMLRARLARIEMLAAFSGELAQAGEKGLASQAAAQAYAAGRALGSRPDRAAALAAAAQAFAAASESERAAQAARQSLEEAQQIKPRQDRAGALLQAGRALAATGDPGAAVAAARQALETIDKVPEARTRAILLGEAACVLAAAGAVKRALAAAGQVQKTARSIRVREKALALIDAAQAMRMAGAGSQGDAVLDNALALVAKIKEPGEQAQALNRAGRTCLEAGDLVQAEALAGRAIQAAGQAPSAAGRAVGLAGAAHLLAQLGRHERALPVFQTALAAARQVGREAVFAVLRDGAPVIRTARPAETLADTYQAIMDVESWW